MDPMENQAQVAESTQEPLSHFREAKNKYGQIVYVPVVDVRDGIVERTLAEQIIKASNRSRYIVYNRYHVSKKDQNRTL